MIGQLIYIYLINLMYVGAQRFFLILAICLTIYCHANPTQCGSLHLPSAEWPNSKETKICHYSGFVYGNEIRSPTGVLRHRYVRSLIKEASYADKNEDGRWDKIIIRKNNIWLFQIPDEEFDQHFGERWRNGRRVVLEDKNYDGCFEQKILSETTASRDKEITTVLMDQDCDGVYEIKENHDDEIFSESFYEHLKSFFRLSIDSCFENEQE